MRSYLLGYKPDFYLSICNMVGTLKDPSTIGAKFMRGSFATRMFDFYPSSFLTSSVDPRQKETIIQRGASGGHIASEARIQTI